MTLQQKAKSVWVWFSNAWTVKDVVVFVVTSTSTGAFIGGVGAWLFNHELNLLGVLLAALVAGVTCGVVACLTVRIRLKPALLAANREDGGTTRSLQRQQGERRRLIRQARSFVASACAAEGASTDFRQKLESTSLYYQLRPHLTDEFRESVGRAGRTLIVPPCGSELPGLAHCFLDELERLEREWRI